jgi:hypothetical protein
MIALSRADVRRFRAVARRARPPGRHYGPAPPVRVSADGGTLTLAAHLGEVVVALRAPTARPSAGAFTVSMADLDRFDGPAAGVVTLVKAGRSCATARWDDGAAPRTAELELVTNDLAWPEEADRLVAMPPHFPAALHEAGRTAAREPGGRYGLHRVQVQGKAGRVVGTDGKQALVQGGYTSPFEDDLLVPAVPVFGSKELAAEAAVSVGRAGDWLYLVIGPWQVWLAIDREGRFPDVMAAFPRSCGIRIEIDDRDADAVLAALPGRAAGRDGPRPVTLDLGPAVAARARDDRAGEVVELPLPNTQYAGPPTRVVLDHGHLTRALALGFREFRTRGAGYPVAARADDRLYLTVALDPSAAVPPGGAAGPAAASAIHPAQPCSVPIPVRSDPMSTRDAPSPDRNGHADPPHGEALDPLAEAEALRGALAEAAGRAARLVAVLKQFRRERRALASAWSSLKQLNLGP